MVSQQVQNKGPDPVNDPIGRYEWMADRSHAEARRRSLEQTVQDHRITMRESAVALMDRAAALRTQVSRMVSAKDFDQMLVGLKRATRGINEGLLSIGEREDVVKFWQEKLDWAVAKSNTQKAA